MEQEDKMETDSPVMHDAVPFTSSNEQQPSYSRDGSKTKLRTKKDDPYYNMKHKNRGKAIIISNITFKKHETREGGDKDMISLKAALNYLHFEIVEITNRTKKELMEELEILALKDYKEDDCLLVAIMTHGCKKGLSAVDDLFELKDVREKFMPGNCKSLTGKPKIFLIQACRGKDGEEFVKAHDAKEKEKFEEIYLIPSTCDVLEFHSSNEGKVAARNTTQGSWFIQHLAAELQASGYEKPLLDIFTIVIKKVALDCEYEEGNQVLKQQPVIMSTLSRILKFVPKE